MTEEITFTLDGVTGYGMCEGDMEELERAVVRLMDYMKEAHKAHPDLVSGNVNPVTALYLALTSAHNVLVVETAPKELAQVLLRWAEKPRRAL